MKLVNNKSLRFHCYEDGVLWASKANKIIVSDDLGKTWNQYLKVDKLSLLSKSCLFNRLTRSGIHNVIPIKNNVVVIVIKKYILVYKNSQLRNKIKIKKGSRPLRNGIIYLKDCIIFGDYFSNSDRITIKIYNFKLFDDKLKTLLTFNNKRHIHFIQQDILDGSKLFIGTGDKNSESGIYRYDLETNHLEVVGSGNQKWRAVSLLQKKNYLYWGSDCPYKQNYIFRFDRGNRNLERVVSIEGPAYYSTINSEGEMFIATTIEDRDKHRAIIYSSKDGIHWEKVKEWKKDILPEKLFGYGIIEFIKGQENLDDLYINLNGLI